MNEAWENRAFFKYKHEQLKYWVEQCAQPFDYEDMAKANQCSESAASSALRRYFVGRIRYHRKHVGSGNFRITYFPLAWNEDQCRAWMDGNTKSGKSKAGLYTLR